MVHLSATMLHIFKNPRRAQVSTIAMGIIKVEEECWCEKSNLKYLQKYLAKKPKNSCNWAKPRIFPLG